MLILLTIYATYLVWLIKKKLNMITMTSSSLVLKIFIDLLWNWFFIKKIKIDITTESKQSTFSSIQLHIFNRQSLLRTNIVTIIFTGIVIVYILDSDSWFYFWGNMNEYEFAIPQMWFLSYDFTLKMLQIKSK